MGGPPPNAALVGGIGKVALLLEEDSENKDGTYLLLRQVTTNLLAPRKMEAEEQVSVPQRGLPESPLFRRFRLAR